MSSAFDIAMNSEGLIALPSGSIHWKATEVLIPSNMAEQVRV